LHGALQLSECLRLAGGEAAEAIDHEAVGQFVVALDLAAEEEGECGDKQGWTVAGGLGEKPGESGVVVVQGGGDLSDSAAGGVNESSEVGVATEFCRGLCNLGGEKSGNDQTMGATEFVQFGEAGLAEGLGGFSELGSAVGEEEAQLVAKAILVGGAEVAAEAAQQAIAGEGAGEGFPGVVVGVDQGAFEGAAVVGEVRLDAACQAADAVAVEFHCLA
jgi:hypothetical protein